MEPKALRVALRIWVVLVLAFLFVPIVLIVLYSFNRSNIESWPIAGFSLHWYSVAFHDPQVRSAFLLSLRVGLFATVLALLLGSAVAYACTSSRSSAARPYRSCSYCRLPCPASSPGSR